MTKPLLLLDPHPRPRQRIFDAAQWARLHTLLDVVEAEDGAPMPDALVDRHLPGAVALLGQTALPAERLDQARSLRAIINVEGNFYGNVDYARAFAKGIAILSVAPAFAVPVAEMSLALALDLARGVTLGDRAMRAGQEVYGTPGNADAVLLSRARVGIIGYGNIGRALRRLLRSFGAQVGVYDPWLPDGMLRDEEAEPMELDALLAGSQFIFVLAGVTAENEGFLGRERLERIAPGSIVVLAGRAGVVDFPAFVALADAGRFRAATDVFPVEPVPAEDGVRGSRLLLSAHRAGGMPATALAMGEMILDDLSLILRGLPPVRLQAAHRETVGWLRSPPARSFAAARPDQAPPAGDRS